MQLEHKYKLILYLPLPTTQDGAKSNYKEEGLFVCGDGGGWRVVVVGNFYLLSPCGRAAAQPVEVVRGAAGRGQGLLE